MARLGSFLLKRLRKRPATVKTHARIQAKGSAPSLKKVKLEPKNPSAKNLPAPTLVRAPFIETHVLTIAEMIRPNGLLRASIEAFLLDLRSKHTRRAYGKDLKRFVQFLLSHAVDQTSKIDRHVVIAYKDSLLGEGLEHTTVDRHLASLRSFFNWMVEDELLDKNPAEKVRFLNPRRTSPTIGFSDPEVIQVLAGPHLHLKSGSLHYAILMILFFCGLRRSEVCDLRTTNIGFERDHHFLRLRGKGNAERIVVLVPVVWSAIEHYLKISHKDIRVDEPLFSPIRNNRTLIRNKPLDPSMIYYIVTRYAKLAGIKNRVSPHSCRATAISNARDHDVTDRAIQEFAGWSTPNMITRYDKRKTALEKSAAHAIRYGESERVLPVKAALK
jgi:integrase/recombinase XerD